MTEPSPDPAMLVDQMAALVGLSLQPDHRPGVIENFVRITAIAQLVTEFPLPEEIEIAPVFEP
ncbi:MAG TPA: DUF4089 domain-containing protein [Crinalium sp.]